MKSFLSLVLSAMILLSLFCFCSCNAANLDSDSTSNAEKTDSLGVSNKAQGLISSENYEVTVSGSCWVHSDDDLALIRERAENGKKSDIYGNLNYPIFKMDSKADLEEFKADFGEIFDIYNPYNSNSFEKNTLKYDELFFENNTLFVIYIGDTSSSLVYGVDSVCVQDDFLFKIDIKQINDPEDICEDITGELLTVAIPTSLVGNCVWFDAY